MRTGLLALALTAMTLLLVATSRAADCVDCHAKITPNIVSDWKQSKHSQGDVGCDACHGDGHMSAEDVAKVQIPTPETCAACHDDAGPAVQARQARAGLGGDEGHADHPLAADGADRRA